MSLKQNQLQEPIVMRLSLSAETANYEVSFLSTAPLLMLFLSLGCLFIDCRNQISAVFLYRPKPKSMYFLSFHFAPLILARLSLGCLFQNRNGQNMWVQEWRITGS
jgi:hypothetical protein